jgi:predicted metal-dependent HD superfamily phosphohydrolase
MSHISQLGVTAAHILTPFRVSEEATNLVIAAYSEKWRGYHNASHIMQMLVLSRRFYAELTEREQQLLESMILYHDVWYKIGRPVGENERRSAAWACNDLRQGGSAFLKALREGIEATIKHSLDDVSPSNFGVVSALLDLDLWGLGQKLEYFKRTNEMIWREYEPVTTREEFKQGRAAWAQSFLDSRKKIYRTEAFADLEAQARQNLAELAAG